MMNIIIFSFYFYSKKKCDPCQHTHTRKAISMISPFFNIDWTVYRRTFFSFFLSLIENSIESLFLCCWVECKSIKRDVTHSSTQQQPTTTIKFLIININEVVSQSLIEENHFYLCAINSIFIIWSSFFYHC